MAGGFGKRLTPITNDIPKPLLKVGAKPILENIIEEFINNSYQEGIKKVIVVTGKGTRSKTANNPYLSRDLSILKHSVPEFIKSNSSLMNKIKQISEANIEDGGSGAFYIYFKN